MDFTFLANSGGFFNNYIGLGGTFGVRRNSIDLTEVNKYSGINPIYASTSYRCNYLLANLIFKFPIAPNFYLYLKGGGGITFNSYPELYTSSTKGSQPEQKITADALAYGLGGGFKYSINNIGFGLEAYSLYTSPNFQIYSTTSKQDMHTVNYSFNLSFNFK
jgi:opacity protein-like surface antigen